VCHHSLEEIYDLAKEAWLNNLNHLEAVAQSINPERSWQEQYHKDALPTNPDQDVLSRYREETDRLKHFFKHHGFAPYLEKAALSFRETPTYLRSVRGSASFSSALCAQEREPDFFYITTQWPEQDGTSIATHRKNRLHREYRFLAAHETVPGHHLLDTARRALKNPVRRQIESPLFYEGWATYAETLLMEYAYMDTPMDHLLACKRKLWRAARCQIDVGLNTGHLSKGNAIELLVKAGFSADEARNQVERYPLNPGYQLCYTLGSHMFTALKAQYGQSMGRDRFHRLILQGGEIPFPWVAKRLEKDLYQQKRSASS
jgi:uncharacterized protein (DUF885 family)